MSAARDWRLGWLRCTSPEFIEVLITDFDPLAIFGFFKAFPNIFRNSRMCDPAHKSLDAFCLSPVKAFENFPERLLAFCVGHG